MATPGLGGGGDGLDTVLGMWARRVLPPDPTVADKRAAYETVLAQLPVDPEAVAEPIDAGGVAALRVCVGAAPARTIVHVHGGGFIMGSPQGYRSYAAALSRTADAEVVLIDYGLAPERPFPAGLRDTVTALRWAGGSGPVVLAGDSAGGGLALAALQVLRDEGEPLPSAYLGLSPWVDLSLTALSLDEFVDDPVVTKESLQRNVELYLGGADPVTRRHASPLHGDLAGLPPALIFGGARERLRDDAIALQEGLAAAEVPVELSIVPDVPHVWPVFCSVLEEGMRSVRAIAAFLERVDAARA